VPRLVLDKSPPQAELRPLEVSPGVGEFHVGLCTPRRKLASPLWAATDVASKGRSTDLDEPRPRKARPS
jgi:hypothetical protein